MTYKVIQAILLMTIVTYGARVIPLLLLRGRKIDGFLKEFIELVPVALLAALIIPDIVLKDSTNLVIFKNPSLGAAILTFLFARYVPNLFLSIIFGMVVYWGLNLLF